MAAENAELMKRITQLECRDRVGTVGERYEEDSEKVMPAECDVKLLNDQITTLTHRVEALTFSNRSLKNELLIKTKVHQL